MFKIGLIRITNFIKGTLIGANQRYVYNAIIDINPDNNNNNNNNNKFFILRR